MKIKGSAVPLYIAVILMVMVLFFGVLYFFVGKPIMFTVDIFENNAPASAPGSVFDNLDIIWAAIPILGMIAVVIWAFAKSQETEVGGVYGS